MAFTLLVISIAAFGQTGPAAKKSMGDLTAEQIIAKSIDATGGKAAMDKIKTTVTKATIEVVGQGLTGTSEEGQKAPNKVYSDVTLSGIGSISQGYDGQVAWSKDPFQGLRQKSGAELAMTKIEAATDAETNWKAYFKSVELVGTEKVGDGDAYVLKFTPNEGQPITRYYDKSSFLMVRQDMVLDTPQGTIPSKSYFSDFRTVDGIKIPFDAKLEQGPGTIHVVVTDVKHNVDIDDAKFKMPSN